MVLSPLTTYSFFFLLSKDWWQLFDVIFGLNGLFKRFFEEYLKNQLVLTVMKIYYISFLTHQHNSDMLLLWLALTNQIIADEIN